MGVPKRVYDDCLSRKESDKVLKRYGAILPSYRRGLIMGLIESLVG